MDLVFDIESSVEFWRQRYPLSRAPRSQACKIPVESAASKREVLKLLPEWVDQVFLAPSGGVFHALDLGGGSSRRFDDVAVHSWRGPVLPGSFYELKPGVYVESPEFMFLHAASFLDLRTIIAFGDELCGYYSFDRREKRGFRRRKVPLATKDGIGRFIEQVPGSRGRSICEKALAHVVEGSASPMETFDEMAFCLPYRYGGYGIPKPLMNHRVDLNGRAMRVAKRTKCYLDMGYPYHHLDVEHHGKLDHSNTEEAERDIARVNGLKEMGFEVIELTVAQVEDLLAFEVVAQRIAKITGKRIHANYLGPLPARLDLRRSLNRWNASSGRIRPS